MSKKTQTQLLSEASEILLTQIGDGVRIYPRLGAGPEKPLGIYWELPYHKKHPADQRRTHITCNNLHYISTSIEGPNDLRWVLTDNGFDADAFSDRTLSKLFWRIVEYVNDKLPVTYAIRENRIALGIEDVTS